MNTLADQIEFAPHNSPISLAEAVPRFIFSMMSDVDTRNRWKAAHVTRSLARLGETEIINNLFYQFDRTSDTAFRNPEAPFYQLGAKLWLMVTACRLSNEKPESLQGIKNILIQIATADIVPHVVIREYAKRAALAATDTGGFQISDVERSIILASNTPKRKYKKGEKNNSSRLFRDLKSRKLTRFHFDEMDTVPYWYSGLLNVFPTVSMETILTMAERWILDVWNTPVDQNAWVKEPRRGSRLTADN